MPAFNPQKLADLVNEESGLKHELEELSLSLKEQHESDGAWGEDRLNKYSADQARHAQLDRELKAVRDERRAYELQEPAAAGRSARSALSRWLRDGNAGLEADERETMLSEIRNSALPGGGGETFILSAASASDASSGEEAVQETVLPRVIDRLAHYGGVSQMAQQFMSATGNEYRIPQMDAATQEGEFLDAQNTETANEDIPDIGIQSFGAKTISSKSILITRELLQDSVFDVQSYAERQAVRRIGRVSNKFFTVTQAGTGMPVGVVSSAKVGLTAAAADKVTWVELTDLIYAINRAYREGGEMGEGGFSPELGGRIGYMISDNAEKAIRVLLDNDGRPLWVPSTREGAPSMLNGHPYVVNGHMDAVATGNVPILFGNFSYYGIRTVAAIEIFRFMDSRTMQRNTVECLAFARRDARPMGALVSDACEAYAKLTMA